MTAAVIPPDGCICADCPTELTAGNCMARVVCERAAPWLPLRATDVSVLVCVSCWVSKNAEIV